VLLTEAQNIPNNSVHDSQFAQCFPRTVDNDAVDSFGDSRQSILHKIRKAQKSTLAMQSNRKKHAERLRAYR
jgi:hypothetical protein